MSESLKVIAKFTALTLIFALIWMLSMVIATAVFGIDIVQAPDSSGNELIYLLLTSAINTAVIYLLVHKSIWKGWKLMAAISFILFGIQFFMSQIEAFYFNEGLKMPVGIIYSVICSGFILAVSFSLIVVKMLGKWQTTQIGKDVKISLTLDFIFRMLFLCIIVYPALYFLAGYFIAWQLPELRLLYSGSEEILPLFQHMQNAFRSDPLLFPFQVLRGLLWITMAILIIKFLDSAWKIKAVLTGLTFALLMNAQHLIPNPYMPDMVRLFHFIETASSNFIWGFVIVWILAGMTHKQELT